MRRKGLIVLGVLFLAFLALQSCKSSPEKSLLAAYFNAISMKDTTTMAKMAIEPASIDIQTWNIANVSEETASPVNLAELGKKEMEAQKKLQDHIGPVMDAEDALYTAQEEQKASRTGAARAAAKRKVDEMQAKFDQEREVHKQLQREYNEAKAAAQKERDIAIFSLDAGEIPNIMDLTGTVHSKEVDVNIVGKDGQQKTHRFNLRRYELKDEVANLTRRGRWIIVRYEPVA